MNKMIVAVFENETTAFEGLEKLKELHTDGAISLYGYLIISKDNNGVISGHQMDGMGPIGTAVGITLGGLVGLLGGPAAALAGATGASMAGMIYDMNNAGVDAEFIDDVSEAMVSGTTAILADIEEEWMAPLDAKMIESNGVIFRRLRLEVEDDQIEREIELAAEDLDRLEAELEASEEEMKENIRKHVDATKKKLTVLADRAKEKQDKLEQEIEEKINTLKEQLKDANEKNKAKINAKIDKIKADHKARIDKLKRAWEAAKTELNREI